MNSTDISHGDWPVIFMHLSKGSLEAESALIHWISQAEGRSLFSLVSGSSLHQVRGTNIQLLFISGPRVACIQSQTVKHENFALANDLIKAMDCYCGIKPHLASRTRGGLGNVPGQDQIQLTSLLYKSIGLTTISAYGKKKSELKRWSLNESSFVFC